MYSSQIRQWTIVGIEYLLLSYGLLTLFVGTPVADVEVLPVSYALQSPIIILHGSVVVDVVLHTSMHIRGTCTHKEPAHTVESISCLPDCS